MGGFRQELNQDSVIQSLADEGTVCRKSSNYFHYYFQKYTCFKEIYSPRNLISPVQGVTLTWLEVDKTVADPSR